MPYNDMARWVMAQVNMKLEAIINSKEKFVAYLKANVFNEMYHLKPTEITLNTQFLNISSQSTPNLLRF